MSMIHVENWTRKDVQFRFLYKSGMAEGSLKSNAACPTKMSIPPSCISLVWRIDRTFLANSHTHLSTNLEIYTGKDGNKHWIPTQKVEFEKPLQAGAPPKKIVLKVPRKGESNVDDTTLPPTPMNEKIEKEFGPGSPTDLA